MIGNSAVTIYHQTETGFCRQFFPRASVYRKTGIQTGNSGQDRSDQLIIRIFTQCDVQIEPGDRLVIGYSESLLPPGEPVYTILELADNRRGTGKMQHYKLTAA